MMWDRREQSGLATVTKQRDSRTEGAFAFKLADFDVDVRADGSPVTSCVVVPVDGSATTTAVKPATHAEGGTNGSAGAPTGIG